MKTSIFTLWSICYFFYLTHLAATNQRCDAVEQKSIKYYFFGYSKCRQGDNEGSHYVVENNENENIFSRDHKHDIIENIEHTMQIYEQLPGIKREKDWLYHPRAQRISILCFHLLSSNDDQTLRDLSSHFDQFFMNIKERIIESISLMASLWRWHTSSKQFVVSSDVHIPISDAYVQFSPMMQFSLHRRYLIWHWKLIRNVTYLSELINDEMTAIKIEKWFEMEH